MMVGKWDRGVTTAPHFYDDINLLLLYLAFIETEQTFPFSLQVSSYPSKGTARENVIELLPFSFFAVLKALETYISIKAGTNSELRRYFN